MVTSPGVSVVQNKNDRLTSSQKEADNSSLVSEYTDLDKRKKNSGHATSFNPKWKEGRPWLRCCQETSPDGLNYDAMYCNLCTKWSKQRNVWVSVGCTSLRLDSINKHANSVQHKEAMSREVSSEADVQSMAEKMTSTEANALKDAQKVLYFLVQHKLPHTTLFKPLVELCCELGATYLPYLSKGKNATYTGHETVNEFLECQAEVVEETIIEEIESGETLGVMLDEYTDVSARKHLAIVGKHIRDGSAQLSFLQDIQLPNGTADTIYSSLKDYLHKKDIPLQKITSFASDGPSVMTGKTNGVVAQLKRDNPHVIAVHCMNHRLQLAVSKAFKSVRQVESVDELLSALYKYYSYSTVKASSLDEIQNVLRQLGDVESDKNLTVKKAVHTRWLSHEKALQSVRKLYEAICMDLENAVSEGRDKKLGDKSGIPAVSLLKMMKAFSKMYFIHMLCDVCCTVAKLTKLFEQETVDLSVIESKQQKCVSDLRKMKKEPGVFLGTMNKLQEKLGITGSEEDVSAARDMFIDKLVDEIEGRLENSELITALSGLNLTEVPEGHGTFYGDQEVTLLASHLGLPVDQTVTEWNDLKELFSDSFTQCTPVYMYSTLLKKQNTIGTADFINIRKLLSVNQTLILSTAPVERVFSQVKLIVTDHRNRLQMATTNNLLMVAMNTKQVSDIDLNRVVEKFLARKKRRIL